MTPSELAKKAIAQFTETITGQIFVMIETDQELIISRGRW